MLTLLLALLFVSRLLRPWTYSRPLGGFWGMPGMWGGMWRRPPMPGPMGGFGPGMGRRMWF